MVPFAVRAAVSSSEICDALPTWKQSSNPGLRAKMSLKRIREDPCLKMSKNAIAANAPERMANKPNEIAHHAARPAKLNQFPTRSAWQRQDGQVSFLLIFSFSGSLAA